MFLDEALPWLRSQREAFEAALNGAPLQTSLGVLARALADALGQDTRAAFYLYRGASLHHVVGMGSAYAEAVDGFNVGPESLACGLALYSRQPVITEDVTKDARWQPWLWLAERFDYRGCWSFPLYTSTGKPVGTFAVYSRLPRQTTERDLELTSLLSRAASIIIARHAEVEARKQAEEEIRRSELRYRTLVNATSAVTWSCPPSGLHVEPQPEWMAFTGQTAEEMLGDGWTRAVHPEDVAAATSTWREAVARGELCESEHRLRRHDGQWRWMSMRAAPVRDAEGEITEWFGMNIDITERKAAEDALRDADRRKDEFLAMLAHELRNLLAPIKTGLFILQSSVDGAKAARVHDIMARQLDHLVRLVDELLEISRISYGRIDLRKKSIDLTQVVNDAVAASESLISEHGHRLTVLLPPEPLPLDADPTRLAQVIANLLNNAAKFTKPGGRIEISARREDREVAVSVRDDGVGIPADKLRYIFDLFTQLDNSLDRSRSGLGIGLAVVRSLVEMHGGRVDARSEGAGRGSELIVYLPLAGSGVPEATEGPPIRAPAPGCARRVLVVDDNRDVADSLALLLENLEADVRVAYDGRSALETVAAFKPEAVFLDLGMPEMDGYETAQRLRRHPDGKRVLLVALSGRDQKEDRRRSLEAGIDRHLAKPIDFSLLQALLAGIVDRRRLGGPAKIGPSR